MRLCSNSPLYWNLCRIRIIVPPITALILILMWLWNRFDGNTLLRYSKEILRLSGNCRIKVYVQQRELTDQLSTKYSPTGYNQFLKYFYAILFGLIPCLTTWISLQDSSLDVPHFKQWLTSGYVPNWEDNIVLITVLATFNCHPKLKRQWFTIIMNLIIKLKYSKRGSAGQLWCTKWPGAVCSEANI